MDVEILPPVKVMSSGKFARSLNCVELLLPIGDVIEITSLSKPTIYRRIAAGEFPRPVPISRGRVAWPASEIAAWQSEVCAAA